MPVQVRIPMPVEVEQAYLEGKNATTQEVITAIEVLSPANKTGKDEPSMRLNGKRF